ncbi:glycine--tRNA ligase [Candidatus Roizmanbacteria bacterium RIFCSPLOWO2_01_FULL_38_12]|uniref:glycine--tRNA ligase n=1 Tax=Candidatus Roizmanbacteria bacterium RIFCSPLOWO2_01_FULL_38_12 TaxID=1802061 RepID=A0A1F7IR33_9BACT|nr:MAG: glycine--tRNA ligase [Candidatus Roizmanbacteria bacterium RIFCSPHIGHO2_12_FULL_38_13]OGK45823.1 MAG: glycine--tRNA ligase [Candidatus Roizmanbacteria bacterium RIFCSPLOWO2_01_FULL_38_12]
MDDIISLAKRRGFFYPSSEIYGGLANTWDFGHYGTLLKNNLRDLWWKFFVTTRTNMVGIEASIFLNPKVWEASGHVSGFTDALIDCKKCKFRTRADHLIEDQLPDTKVEGLPIEKLTEIIKTHKLKCPRCGSSDFTDVRKFNLLFETSIGIVEEAKSKAYLRGEIAQGIFLNYKNVLDTMRVQIPFGIAQVGKAFRNEITMGQAVFRTLEFDLMEFEYFIRKNEWKKTFSYWQEELKKFAKILGIDEQRLRWREHEEHERSHYSTRTVDLEYQFPFGWKEIWAVAYRTDFDLANHMKHSGVNLAYRDQQSGESYIPHVIEPTFGLSRLILVILHNAYRVSEIKGKMRTYLAFDPKIAPIKAAIFPLQKDEKLQKIAANLYNDLRHEFVVEYDNAGNIGKMYRRQDEIGTPYCITIDYQTIDDATVTIRHRDSMKQERLALDAISSYFAKVL